MMLPIVSTCKNCNHRVSEYRDPIRKRVEWKHYLKTNSMSKGELMESCAFCECEKPEVIK